MSRHDERMDVLALLDGTSSMGDAAFRAVGCATAGEVTAAKKALVAARKTIADGAHAGLARPVVSVPHGERDFEHELNLANDALAFVRQRLAPLVMGAEEDAAAYPLAGIVGRAEGTIARLQSEVRAFEADRDRWRTVAMKPRGES